MCIMFLLYSHEIFGSFVFVYSYMLSNYEWFWLNMIKEHLKNSIAFFMMIWPGCSRCSSRWSSRQGDTWRHSTQGPHRIVPHTQFINSVRYHPRNLYKGWEKGYGPHRGQPRHHPRGGEVRVEIRYYYGGLSMLTRSIHI